MAAQMYRDLLSILLKSKNFLVSKEDDDIAFINAWLNKKSFQSNEKNGKKENVSGNADAVSACVKCEGAANKKLGIGSGKNGLFVILNTPYEIDNIEKESLKQESTEILKKIVKAINKEIEDCYITNLIKCDSNDITRPGVMFKNCEPLLRLEISKINPKIILVMGDDRPLVKAKNEFNSSAWFRIDHPMTLAQNPNLKKAAWDTLQKIMTL